MQIPLSIIKHCKNVKQLTQIHAQTIASGLLNLHPSHILTDFLYAITITDHTTVKSPPKNVLSYAVSVFNSIQNPSTFCYNTIVRIHTLLSSPVYAIFLFSQMRSNSVPPDFYSFPFALKAAAQIRAISMTATLHSQVIKFGFVSDSYVVNSMVTVYASLGNLADAHKVFDESTDRDTFSWNALIDGYVKANDIIRARELFDIMPSRDSVSWGTLVAGYAQAKLCKQAIELFNGMMETGLKPDNVALVSALSACAQLGELEIGKTIHDYIKQKGIQVDSFLSTGLVDLYAKCGYIETAVQVFESSLDKNVFTWNAMISGLAMHGHGSLSLNYFAKMINSGLQPDGITFLGVLVGCSHAGLVYEAQNLFNEMESVYNVSRELKHYGCMADLLGRAGLTKEAMKMINKMPTGGDMYTWGGLLGGCRIHGDVEIAEKAAKHLKELKPEDGGVYSIMAHVYANAGRWEDLKTVRKSMVESEKVKKVAGYSLIELNGIMHEFIAGDRLHSHTSEIYMVLDEIRAHQYGI